MTYEIKVLECSRKDAESKLKSLAAQGWQLVSCWPENDKLVAVFQRAGAAQAATPTQGPQPTSVHAPAPLPATPAEPAPLTLETVRDACIAMPTVTDPKTGGTFHEGLSVAKFAKEHGMTKDAMLEALRGLGLNSKQNEADKKYVTFVGDHSLWLKQAGKHGAWYVNVAPRPEKR